MWRKAMHKTAIELERLRQKIEKAQTESGNTSDFMDRGKSNAKELKTAQEFMAKKNLEINELLKEFDKLLASAPKQAVEEWVNWHKGFLKNILNENSTDKNAKTRLFVAKQTMEEWGKVANGTHKHIHINGHFLKDYKERVIKEIG